MKTEYIEGLKGPYWIASGMGPMRQIIAEGGTRREAKNNYLEVYGTQYAEMESHTHFASQDWWRR